jgi:hypothetical protein
LTRTIVHFFAAVLITAVVAAAQTPAPAICGLVTDANKKPVPGAEIISWDGISRTILGSTSDARGHYCVAAYATEKGSSIPPYYSISAMYKGPNGLQVESLPATVQEPQHKVLKINLHIPYAIPSKSGK